MKFFSSILILSSTVMLSTAIDSEPILLWGPGYDQVNTEPIPVSTGGGIDKIDSEPILIPGPIKIAVRVAGVNLDKLSIQANGRFDLINPLAIQADGRFDVMKTALPDILQSSSIIDIGDLPGGIKSTSYEEIKWTYADTGIMNRANQEVVFMANALDDKTRRSFLRRQLVASSPMGTTTSIMALSKVFGGFLQQLDNVMAGPFQGVTSLQVDVIDGEGKMFTLKWQ